MRFIKLSLALAVGISLVSCSSTPPTSSDMPVAPVAHKNLAEASRLNVQLGLNYLKQGHMERAKQKLLQAVNEEPSITAYSALAYYYQLTSDPQKAEEYYLKAIDLQPQAGAGHNNYGAFLCQQKRYQDADQQFQLAVADASYLKTANAYENAGSCAMLVPDVVKAKGYFQKALEQNPRMSNSLLQLAHISADEQNYSAAQDYLTRYAALAKMDAPTLGFAIEIALKNNDQAQLARNVSELKTNFPASAEYQKYQIYG